MPFADTVFRSLPVARSSLLGGNFIRISSASAYSSWKDACGLFSTSCGAEIHIMGILIRQDGRAGRWRTDRGSPQLDAIAGPEPLIRPAIRLHDLLPVHGAQIES